MIINCAAPPNDELIPGAERSLQDDYEGRLTNAVINELPLRVLLVVD